MVETSRADVDTATQSLLVAAHRRLYPSLSDPSYLVLRSRRLIFSGWLNKISSKSVTVLDIGGRYQPYKPLLLGRIHKYIAIDLIRTPLVSVLADGGALPFSAESFDIVIATQVMEYIREPFAAVRQIHAVLKPGGVLLSSFPGCTPWISDSEIWRFTRPGLAAMLAPFERVEIVPELHSLGSIVRTLNLAFDSFVRYGIVRAVYRHTACPIFNVVGLASEKLGLTSNDQFTANYSVFAVKGSRGTST